MNSKLVQESGMILVTVLMAIIVLSIFVTAIISNTLSHNQVSKSEVENIQAQELAQGSYWKTYTRMYNNGSLTNSTETLDGKTFNIFLNANKPVDSTVPYVVIVNYLD